MGEPEDWRAVMAAMRNHEPLVHCLTPPISTSIVADGLLAAGARPMMTETLDEAPTLNTVADALLVNLGSLNTDRMRSIPATVEAARKRRLPWVLDPTGIGIAPIRTPLAHELAGHRPTIICGNPVEVLVLAEGAHGYAEDDEETDAVEVTEHAQELAERLGCVVSMPGETDVITDGDIVARISGGSPLLGRIAGAGRLLGALTAACAAVAPPLDAALAASAWLKSAGERAATRTSSPGTFRMFLLDALDELAVNRSPS